MTFLTRLVLGDALWALRLPCVLAGLTAALITGLTAREFGAGRFGQMLAATCVALAPTFLPIRHVLSMNSFDHPVLVAGDPDRGADLRTQSTWSLAFVWDRPGTRAAEPVAACSVLSLRFFLPGQAR